MAVREPGKPNTVYMDTDLKLRPEQGSFFLIHFMHFSHFGDRSTSDVWLYFALIS